MCPVVTCHDRYDFFMPNTQNMKAKDSQFSAMMSGAADANR